jgi:Flp pilus assembly pilin Flp
LLGKVYVYGVLAVAILSQFVSDERGMTVIEYSLIAAFISVFIITAAQLVGTRANIVFARIAEALHPH